MKHIVLLLVSAVPSRSHKVQPSISTARGGRSLLYIACSMVRRTRQLETPASGHIEPEHLQIAYEAHDLGETKGIRVERA